jgi:hypothetical protein
MTSNAFSAERISFPEARSRSIKTCGPASRRSASLTWLLLRLNCSSCLVTTRPLSPQAPPFASLEWEFKQGLPVIVRYMRSPSLISKTWRGGFLYLAITSTSDQVTVLDQEGIELADTADAELEAAQRAQQVVNRGSLNGESLNGKFLNGEFLNGQSASRGRIIVAGAARHLHLEPHASMFGIVHCSRKLSKTEQIPDPRHVRRSITTTEQDVRGGARRRMPPVMVPPAGATAGGHR